MAKKLTKEDIFKIRPANEIVKIQNVPDYPGMVFGVKVMNAGDQQDYENSIYSFEEKADGGLKAVPLTKDAKIKLVIYTVCDPETGELFFTDKDIPELRKMSGRAIRKLFDEAQKINGIGGEDIAEKNLTISQE